MKTVFLPFAIAGALLCSPAHAVDVKLNKTEWVLQSLSGWHGTSLAQLPRPATLAFNGDNVNGNDGCNLFNGIYTQTRKPNSLRIPTDKMMSTMMACMGDAGKLSRHYLQALDRTVAYQLNGNALTLKDAHGRKLASFTKLATALPGTQWQVQDYHNGHQGVISSQNTARMSVNFDKQGRVTGYAGCNQFFATYTHNPSNNSIRISQIGSTKMLCQQPEGVMLEEAQFLQALGRAKTYRRSGASLTLFDAQGIHVVGLRLKAGE